MEKIILADAENFDDMQKGMRMLTSPFLMFKLGTDNAVKVDNFAKKMDEVLDKRKGRIYIPDDENAVQVESIPISIPSIVMEWRRDLKNRFYRVLNLPHVAFGSSGTTESGGKMEIFAHENVWERDQKTIERQIEEQLGLKIDLISPSSLLDSLQTDENKDANQGLELQPNDVTAGAGR